MATLKPRPRHHQRRTGSRRRPSLRKQFLTRSSGYFIDFEGVWDAEINRFAGGQWSVRGSGPTEISPCLNSEKHIFVCGNQRPSGKSARMLAIPADRRNCRQAIQAETRGTRPQGQSSRQPVGLSRPMPNTARTSWFIPSHLVWTTSPRLTSTKSSSRTSLEAKPVRAPDAGGRLSQHRHL